MNVKQIDAKDTYPIRSAVLRPGLPIETCYFDGDNDELTFHLGAYIDDSLASVASFYFNRNEDFEQEYQFQLRGMATLDKYRDQGLSSALLKTAFPLIKSNHVNLLWCNARIEAIGFYEKVGFTTFGEQFNIEGVGPHIVMKKEI